MISRIWHGWTTRDNAEVYKALLREDILVGIEDRKIEGFRNIRLLCREVGDEVEFVTVMEFDCLCAVKAFADEEHGVAVVPPETRAVLWKSDQRSQHYDVRIGRR